MKKNYFRIVFFKKKALILNKLEHHHQNDLNLRSEISTGLYFFQKINEPSSK